ncbi:MULTISPECIES: helix-turn-helix domain-containing protein [Shewanella]|jgi:HTH-type transcriptional regulator/antitoxin HipB|uniref:Helix-turn-helix domain-containing protein n=1 Tax=Shewanella algicola TaxID=640633 RepID=A0A9X1ZA45_9GAMM|nr:MULTISPECIES: helix-turn-helix domain-containing protein [Shewanella]MCL1106457.1 helix-turn-helix domain-containing protein [Shewanella algicola]UAL42616.1 helix-turn-helix domain-containing protein [Shewanella inventionis]GGP69532.1 transcriptional regulator [Shewanella algicola]
MKVTNSKQLSAYLKDARLNMKLSQSKAASKVGIRQDTVSSFEQNPDSTKLETLFKILSALNLELDIKVRNPELGGELVDDKAIPTEQEWKEEW